MTCSDFVEGFSDYFDESAPRERIRDAEDHLESCASCRRYRQVLARGAELLRALPEPDVAEDFVPRLQHRLYHVDAEAALRRHTSSGSTALAVLGMAVLLTAVAWSPALRPSAPVVELPPIVVSRPPLVLRLGALGGLSAFAATERRETLEAGLWEDAHVLLFEYSRLARRYGRRSPLQRAGLEQGR